MPFATTRRSFFDGHLDLMLPCAAWKSSFDAPLRWQSLVRTSAEFVGPDDCNGDTMLLPEHAATFAAFVKDAQQQALTRSSDQDPRSGHRPARLGDARPQALPRGLSSAAAPGRHHRWHLPLARKRYLDTRISSGSITAIAMSPSTVGDWKLTDLLDRIEASSATTPAPYLRNEWLAKWPKQLLADIQPMPQCSLPNWLDSWAFPSRDHPTFIELYIGGAGAKFPILHFDNWHTHAFLMQLYGEKEYLALAPDQGRFLYPQEGAASNKSGINDVLQPDLERFPLFAQARGIRFTLSPGETLFVPAGWWHTARILTTSITVSINGANTSNWKSFAKDYCGSIGADSRAKAAVLLVYMNMLGELLKLGSWFAK